MTEPTSAEVLKIAAEARMDVDTVRKVFAGERVRPSSRVRVEDAVRRLALGIEVPR